LTSLTLDDLKQAIVHAGLELYRTSAAEIRVAERIRMHLMDSGVAVAPGLPARVSLTIRGQRSDFPGAQPQELLELVRRTFRGPTAERGFHEVNAASRDITDPVDESSVLDVWHELTFAKDVDGVDMLIEDLRWALSVPKCISP